MKLSRIFFTLLVVMAISFSCKSEKKEAGEAVDAAVEETTEAAEEVADAPEEESAEATEEATEEGAEEATEESTEEAAPEEKKITVVFPKDTKLQDEVKDAMKELTDGNPEMQGHFNDAYAFAVFPKITKGGLGIGGAGGHGLVFDNKTVIGQSNLAQATFGLQAGGQQYMEVIFFEDQPALERFTGGKVKFSGQASAVALKDGASVDIDYQDGVAIFTKTIGGLMAEASVGGQTFKYKPGIN
ncbi:YSC84-related protein [Lutimonas zeaxanthinifaciens]|nr:YSC84-related protein [Lutimonas sp. YSD2104]WKK66547.1 YSC84-related protein [Lutimonas sp. YSD2104]